MKIYIVVTVDLGGRSELIHGYFDMETALKEKEKQMDKEDIIFSYVSPVSCDN